MLLHQLLAYRQHALNCSGLGTEEEEGIGGEGFEVNSMELQEFAAHGGCRGVCYSREPSLSMCEEGRIWLGLRATCAVRTAHPIGGAPLMAGGC